MKYLTIAETAKKWNMSKRRVQDLCSRGRIAGADKWGRAWRIPTDAEKPADCRRRDAEKRDGTSPVLPRFSNALVYTDLYNTPGTADACIQKLKKNQPAAAELLTAEFCYYRGDIDAVYERMQQFRVKYSGFRANLSVTGCMAACAMYRGDVALWQEAKKLIFEIPGRNVAEKKMAELALAVFDISLNFIEENIPDWLIYGRFDGLPLDCYPYCIYAYAKYYFALAFMEATKKPPGSPRDNMALMRFLPRVLEPLCSHAQVEGNVMSEIYLRLICAGAYHNTGNDEHAIPHIDRAVALALKDRLYAPLAENRRPLDYLLDARLEMVDAEAAKTVKQLNQVLLKNWAKIHDSVTGKKNTVHLTMREHEVVKLAVFGLSNQEIAVRLCISISSVKQAIRLAMDKTGAESRKELYLYL